MTTQTSTLAEFLLREIAADEAVAEAVLNESNRLNSEYDLGVAGPEDFSWWADFDGGSPSVSVGPARALAQCKAHRAIVEDLAGLVDYDRDEFIVSPQVEAVALRTLKRMAQPYADRDGFDPRWAL